MKHHLLEKYSELESPIHSLDGRIKLIIAVVAVVLISTLKGFWGVGIFAPLLIVAILVSGVPVIYIIKRALIVLPFVLFVVIFSPLPFIDKILLIIRSIVCAGYMVLLAATTGFNNIVHALRGLKVPPIMVMIISFMIRYLFIIANEAGALHRAYLSRSFGRNSFFKVKGLSALIGSLFLRSYSRGERVYNAMLSRGFKEGMEH